MAMDHILEEEILERLPMKSLVRLKSVSKQWKSMIESNYLAKKRLVRYPNPKLFALRLEWSSHYSIRSLFLETISKDQQEDHSKILVYSYKYSHPHQIQNFHYWPGRIVGYCNGLLCIFDLGYIHLFNPTTRNLRTLFPEDLREDPNISFPWLTGRLPGWSYECPVRVGFGRDIVTGAYKLILMYAFKKKNSMTEIFNLESGKRRCIHFPIAPTHDLINDQVSVFAKGWLFWLTKPACYLPQKPVELVAIDLHTEEFRHVTLPSCYTEYSESAYLWSLRDCLCLSDVLQYPNMEVWALQQQDPSVKWEKIRSVNIWTLGGLDPNFWQLGRAACFLREKHTRTNGYEAFRYDYYLKSRRGYKPSNHFLEQVRDHPFSTVLYTEDLVSRVV